MDYIHFAILLVMVGLALLVAEFFIPSGGFILILALISLGGAMFCVWKQWMPSQPQYFWSFVGCVVGLLPVVLGGAVYVFPKTSIGKRILLEAPKLEEVTPYADEDQTLSALVGKRGKTIGLLNPGGLVSVDGERMHCECQGMLVEPGEEVEVVAVRGNRLVVRQVVDQPAPALGDAGETQASSDAADGDSSPDSPLDFDVPQS